MKEIRTISEAECEEYLSVLCSSFGLDSGRARTAFFSEPYFSLDRKWAYFRGRSIISILTVVPIEFGDGKGIGIAGVATREGERGEGYASELLNTVCMHYSAVDAGRALLFARADSLYLKSGFRELDKVLVQPLPAGRTGHPKPVDKVRVREIYDDWSSVDHRRLRRDEARWNYWSWTFRTPLGLNGGYFCYETSRIREVVPIYESLPISDMVDFYGTGETAKNIGVELTDPSTDLLLMGRHFDYVPQLMMTDQF